MSTTKSNVEGSCEVSSTVMDSTQVSAVVFSEVYSTVQCSAVLYSAVFSPVKRGKDEERARYLHRRLCYLPGTVV